MSYVDSTNPLALAWEEAGRRAAAALDGCSAAVVASHAPEAAAWVALGIAAEQAAHRRVVVGDLVGELPALQRLVDSDDPHGIVDSFLYGVSINKIAHAVDARRSLFVLPSGSEPVVPDEILRNERWHRLKLGFREVGALLLLVARADAPGLARLDELIDGAVLVEEPGQPALPALPRVLATVTAPAAVLQARHPTAADVATFSPIEETMAAAAGAAAGATAGAPAGAPTTPALPAAGPELTGAAATRGEEGSERSAEPGTEAEPEPVAVATAPPPEAPSGEAPVVERRRRPRPPKRRSAWWMPAAGALAAAAVASVWLVYRQKAPPRPVPARADTAVTAAADTPRRVDSAAAGIGAPIPNVANPADSAAAASFGIEVAALNTQSGAILRLQSDAAKLPAATYAPSVLGADSALWFRVVAGAYAERAAADSVLAALRARGILEPGTGTVVRAPFALLLDADVMRDNAPALVGAYLGREVPAYALVQPDGSARIYAGAFATPEDAELLASTLRAKGITSSVVYRTGRVY